VEGFGGAETRFEKEIGNPDEKKKMHRGLGFVSDGRFVGMALVPSHVSTQLFPRAVEWIYMTIDRCSAVSEVRICR
jgi:hypothetical protein